MRGVLIFDADNTIWDTDGVFRAAQLALLQTFFDAGLLKQPEEHVRLLREVDARLVSLKGRAEYNFKVLAATLAYHFVQHAPIEAAIEAALACESSSMHGSLGTLIDSAYEAFSIGLQRPPALYEDTVPVLSAIRASSTSSQPMVMLLLSEGDTNRLERVLSVHGFRESTLFDEIILREKSVVTMWEARELGLRLLGGRGANMSTRVVMVGDSLHRDIEPARQASMVTIYKPSPYKGVESAAGPDREPDYCIRTLGEMPRVLQQIGFTVTVPQPTL